MDLGSWTQLLRTRLTLLGLLRSAGTPVLTGLVGAHLVAGLAPAATALATGWLVRGGGRGSALSDIMVPLAVLVATVIVGQFAQTLREPLDVLAARRIDGRFRADIRRLVARPAGIAHLENGDYAADVARASDLGGWRRRTAGTAAVGQLTLTGRLFGGLAAAAVVAWYSVLLAVTLFVGTLLARAIVRRQWMRLNLLYDARAKDRQRVKYWSTVLSGQESAKEVRLFGLSSWLGERRRAQALGWLTVLWPARRRVLRHQYVTFLLAGGTGFAAFYVPGAAAARGQLSAADLITILLAAAAIFVLGAMGHEAFDIEYGTGAVRAFERLRVVEAGRTGAGAAERPPVIHFEQVTFRYQDADRPVLDRLDLQIGAGEVLAIVGRNGAGKTTLVKLLGGLYEPVHGRITADGIDLRDRDPTAWRRRLSAVFQDFVRYPGTVRDNVFLGAPEAPVDDAAIHHAIDLAGARDLVERLPDGLDTVISRDHGGKVDLSGGQWQKIAISRALYAVAHGRQVLILDEPTAHLDVHAEAAFHDRVLSTVAGATVVLISHRLATVRRADRIVLLDEGRITEHGTHSELLSLGGRYAHLYELQAKRFRVDALEEAP